MAFLSNCFNPPWLQDQNPHLFGLELFDSGEPFLGCLWVGLRQGGAKDGNENVFLLCEDRPPRSKGREPLQGLFQGMPEAEKEGEQQGLSLK